MNKYILIFLGVAIVGVVAWLLLRKKSSSVAQNNTWDNPRPYTPAPVVQPSIPPTQVPIAVPPTVPRGPSTEAQVKAGLTLAATAGCVAYTGGAGAPLCGVAAPLAVDLAVSGGKAAYNTVKGWFK